jgi:hypothetical protein
MESSFENPTVKSALPEYAALARPDPAVAARPESKPGGTGLHDLPSVWTLDASIGWLIEGLIPLGGITMLSAPSGEGKTWVAQAIAGCVAHGKPFLGIPVTQRKVIYLDRENPLSIVKRNLDALGIPPTADLLFWGGWNTTSPPDPTNAEWATLIEFVERHQPVLIFDSLIRFHTGDEQSAKETRDFMIFLRQIADKGATVIVVHHMGKDLSKPYRGSSDIEASVDMAYELKGTPRDGAIHRIALKNFKCRFAPGKNFGMEFISGQGFRPTEVTQQTNAVSIEELVDGIIREFPGSLQQEVIEYAKVRDLSRNRVLGVLRNRQGVRGPGKGLRYYPPAEAVAV